MNADLQSLIRLQELDLTAERLRRQIADVPAAQAALDERISALTAAVDAVKARMADSQAARREIEKELAAVQARLSKYKGQLMEVKTNKEYHAVQTEIATAEELVRSHEDRLLDRMEEAETQTSDLKAAERDLKAGQSEVAGLRKQMDADRAAAETELASIMGSRSTVAASIAAPALALFEQLSRHRKGVGLSEARDGHCTQCHVRLRPQVYNTLRRNEQLIQCESCSRILYFVPPPAAAAQPQNADVPATNIEPNA
jgi:predicted  nucleic acid-binding Zn-ribbon protein